MGKMLLLAAVFAATAAQAVDLTVDQVRGRFPWNGLVDIDYTIAREANENDPDLLQDQLKVMFVDPAVPAVTNVARIFQQAPLPVSSGSHRITWCANDDGFTGVYSNLTFTLAIDHYRESYMMIDVSSGTESDTYPVTYLNAKPDGGFATDAYRGTKIILRLIPPGTYVAGSPDDEPTHSYDPVGEKQHVVAITKPFYLGIFETTWRQYTNVISDVKTWGTPYYGDYRPVNNVGYEQTRGYARSADYCWPSTTNVNSDLFFGRLRARCKRADGNGDYTIPVGLFDLPTEFQWEYAARAGTTTPFATGNACPGLADLSTDIRNIGLSSDNSADCDYKDGGPATVGLFAPNAWGLYDMHGNAIEACLDYYNRNDMSTSEKVDPTGAVPPSASARENRICRGGCCNTPAWKCRSAWRPTSGYAPASFRICCPVQ